MGVYAGKPFWPKIGTQTALCCLMLGLPGAYDPRKGHWMPKMSTKPLQSGRSSD